MQTGEYIEFFVKDSFKANVASLTWIYRNVLMSLLSLLFAQYLRILTMLL